MKLSAQRSSESYGALLLAGWNCMGRGRVVIAESGPARQRLKVETAFLFAPNLCSFLFCFTLWSHWINHHTPHLCLGESRLCFFAFSPLRGICFYRQFMNGGYGRKWGKNVDGGERTFSYRWITNDRKIRGKTRNFWKRRQRIDCRKINRSGD